MFERGFDSLRKDKWRRYLRYTAGEDATPAHLLPGMMPSSPWAASSHSKQQPRRRNALVSALTAFSQRVPHSLLALGLLTAQALVLLVMLWLMLAHHWGTQGLGEGLKDKVASLQQPEAVQQANGSSGEALIVELSEDLQRMYNTMLQTRVRSHLCNGGGLLCFCSVRNKIKPT